MNWLVMASSKAIVLSKERFGESDCYIHFLTQNWGSISCLAKAARKSKRRYVGGLDLFCHDEIFLKGDPRDKPYLVELTVLNSFHGLRENLDRLTIAGRTTQWVRKLADVFTPIPKIYSLLGQTLALLEREDSLDKMMNLELLFRLKLLLELGLKPRTECSCGRTNENQTKNFDITSGGVLCRGCLTQNVSYPLLSVEECQILENSETLKISQWEDYPLPSHKTQHLGNLLTQFAAYHSHTKLPG